LKVKEGTGAKTNKAKEILEALKNSERRA